MNRIEKVNVTIKDIAKLANVSTATVSHVLNNTRYVSPDTAERVRQAVKALDYRSNYVARALRSSRTHTIGVIIPDIRNAYFAQAVHTIGSELSHLGYSIILCNSQDDHQKELEQFERLRSWYVDGIIMIPCSDVFDYSTLYSRDCPIVFLDRRPNTENYHGAFPLFYDSIFSGLEQLIQQGHKRIACLLGEVRYSVIDRYNAYMDVLKKHNLPIDIQLIPSGISTVESGYKRMEYICRGTDATAVFLGNQFISLGAMQYLTDHSIKVPEEMAVVSFGCHSWIRLLQFPVNDVFIPMEQLAISATQLLKELISDPDMPPKHIELNAYLTDTLHIYKGGRFT